MSAIRLGAWGLGRIGFVHVENFATQTDRYEVVAGCDVEQPKVDKLVADYGCAGYTNAEDLLADPNVELVIIATRSLTHVANALQALAAGKFVLLEKPIAMSQGEIEQLRQADRNYPGKLFFLHNHRFEPAMQQIFGIVRSGLLGDLIQVKLCRHHAFSRRADWQAYLRYGGGQLSNWGSHIIDHALQFIGGPVQDIWGNLKGVNTIADAETHVKVVLTGENGIVVDLEISNNVALPGPLCTVYGSRGSLICADEKQIRLRYLDPDFEFGAATASTDSPPLSGGHWADMDLPWRDETQTVEPDTNMWVYVEIETARHLYRAVREGVPFPIANADALEVSRIIQVVKCQNPEFKWDF
ncbi:MAG: Gfo/Idh/MocA family oxidoreductase [Armatimonadetes bacterium]|nr:Gfo/Idh/MocA family oxidoreductase [Armatimonadota bacterium]